MLLFWEALGNVERQFILSKCRLPWYVKSALWKELCAAKWSFNESFTSVLNESPSKCQRPLVFYPSLSDGDWDTQWISGARIWMGYVEGISYGQPSNDTVERQSQRRSLAVPSAPKIWAKTPCWNCQAFRDLIHNSTDENKLFSQHQKNMSVALSKRLV